MSHWPAKWTDESFFFSPLFSISFPCLFVQFLYFLSDARGFERFILRDRGLCHFPEYPVSVSAGIFRDRGELQAYVDLLLLSSDHDHSLFHFTIASSVDKPNICGKKHSDRG